MSIETVVAGAYTGTYNSVATGFNDDDGFQLEVNTEAELVQGTDIFAGTIIDLVHRGMNAYISFTSMVYKAGTKTPFYPWGAFGVISTSAAPVGRLGSAVAAPLVMTAVSNTPAVTLLASLTASKAILPPNSNGRLMYSTKVRKVPVRLLCLPTETGGTTSCWSES